VQGCTGICRPPCPAGGRRVLWRHRKFKPEILIANILREDTNVRNVLNGRSSRRHKAVRFLLPLIASLAATAVSATSATAAGSYIGSNSGGANVRSCASTSCGSYGYLRNGTGVSMLCWVDSQWVSPPNSDYTSNRWFLVSSPVGTGYVHSSLVENQTAVGHC
jgi:hypothetical protein